MPLNAAPSKNPGSASSPLFFLPASLLVLLVLTAFEPLRHNGFINMDDPFYIATNPMVKHGFSWKGIEWAFRSVLLGNWNPVTWMAHMLDSQFFGLNPAGHHLTSVL